MDADILKILSNLKELENCKALLDEKKKKAVLANKKYLHKKRAKELCISLEEYEKKYCRKGRPRTNDNILDDCIIEVDTSDTQSVVSESSVEAEPVQVQLEIKKPTKNTKTIVDLTEARKENTRGRKKK